MVSQAELYNYCVLNPSLLGRVAICLSFSLLAHFMGYGVSVVKGKSSHPPETERQISTAHSLRDRGGRPLAPMSLLTLQDSEAERCQSTHPWASPWANGCNEQVNQSWCDFLPRITWHHQPSSFQGLLIPILPLTRQSRLLPTLEGGSSTGLQRSHSCPWPPRAPPGKNLWQSGIEWRNRKSFTSF